MRPGAPSSAMSEIVMNSSASGCRRPRVTSSPVTAEGARSSAYRRIR